MATKCQSKNWIHVPWIKYRKNLATYLFHIFHVAQVTICFCHVYDAQASINLDESVHLYERPLYHISKPYIPV